MIEYYTGDIIQTFDLNQELCNLCGTCVESCEFNALTIQNGKLYFNPCRCRRCDGCETLCPRGAMAIKMDTINHRKESDGKEQERWWEINSSCVATCDSVCNECGRNKESETSE